MGKVNKKLNIANKPKTRKENDKNCLFVKGGKTSETVNNIMKELMLLKKPLTTQMKRHNAFHPFENETGLTEFSQKFDTSLFVFGSSTKKRPSCITVGRMFDHNLLDMVELNVTKFVSSNEFKAPRPTLGTKPCIILQGTEFENDETMTRIGNLFVDLFKGPSVSQVRLQGLETVIQITAVGKNILFRVYKTILLKSGTKTPRVELIEVGPSIDFQLNRDKLASASLWKDALKVPKELTVKPKKNTDTDVFGTKLARVHVGKQHINTIQTRKLKALKRTKPQGDPKKSNNSNKRVKV
ncbi:Ribosome production factor 2 homolog [Strongyloides ratti]|uniref:Ribosome production factor 2 homolog n=1 Tax=Strongyloides ratti TaxID=34506 RepID=A0A090MXP2_STRRB|nr:Ribosome production factor 2 homolog [Strongyloides ratti]CEF65779.1 Ribosome production factor 2 homolog [Strongyloides ratti]